MFDVFGMVFYEADKLNSFFVVVDGVLLMGLSLNRNGAIIFSNLCVQRLFADCTHTQDINRSRFV